MFRILILQASHSLSDERTEYLVKDRLSFMRFLGLCLADRVPDANSIWNFREALTRAQIDGSPAIEALFRRFEAQLRAAGYIAMGGQIVDATVVAAPKQRNTEDDKRALREGRVPEDWAAKPAKLRQKDRDARWTVKYSKAKPVADGAKRVDIAVPMFGDKNHVARTSGGGGAARALVGDAEGTPFTMLAASACPAPPWAASWPSGRWANPCSQAFRTCLRATVRPSARPRRWFTMRAMQEWPLSNRRPRTGASTRLAAGTGV